MYYELSRRKQAILKAVIDIYIDSGEPVGSKALTQSGLFDLSSATIRNEMAELESLGYLEQPHTSAGRIPTESGYRFYVDALMQDYSLTSGELAELNSMLKAKTAELDQMIKNAGRVMANLTNYTAIAVKQVSAKNTVTRFSVTMIDEHNFLLVMVCADKSAKTRFVRTEVTVNEEALELLQQVLNNFVAGKDLSEITVPYLMQMENCMGRYSGLISPIIKFIYDAVGNEEKDVRIDGMDKLLKYQEFMEGERLQEVLGMFDRKEELLGIMDSAEDDVAIFIGSESGVDALAGSSVVFKKIVVDGNAVGAVGVIGPCRMDYSKVVTAIRYISDGIVDAMTPISTRDQVEAPKNSQNDRKD